MKKWGKYLQKQWKHCENTIGLFVMPSHTFPLIVLIFLYELKAQNKWWKTNKITSDDVFRVKYFIHLFNGNFFTHSDISTCDFNVLNKKKWDDPEDVYLRCEYWCPAQKSLNAINFHSISKFWNMWYSAVFGHFWTQT